MEIYSANEYWVKAASLLHTNPQGTRDLPDSRFARNYFISSHQHGTGNAANKGACQQFQNPLNSAPVQRALFVALDRWATEGEEPPRSRVPTFHDGTLVPPLPQSGMGFPHIPGVTYTGLKTTRYLFNFGPGFHDTGIPTFNPPRQADGVHAFGPVYEDNPANGPIYPSFIPRTDSDGNDLAGVRLADVTVPLATYTGWALRAGPQANDGCEAAGQYIPFVRTRAERIASGDPRPSVEERYSSLDQYTREVARALAKMIKQRLLLCEDFDAELNRLVAAGAAAGLQPAGSHGPPPPGLPKPCTAPDRDDD
jgi:alpha/beta hydrolase family protein